MKNFILGFIALLISVLIGVIPFIASIFIFVYLTYPCNKMTFLEILYSYMMWRFIVAVVIFLFGFYSSCKLFVHVYSYIEDKLDI